MTWTKIERPDLSKRLTRRRLKTRYGPYYVLFCYGRSLGYQRRGKQKTYWVARARTQSGGYTCHRIGRTDDQRIADGETFLSFEQAGRAAWRWFEETDRNKNFSNPMPIGIMEVLNYTPSGQVFTVGHAMHDFVSWKRVEAAKSYVQTLVSLINHHILPRLGTMPVADLNGEVLRAFIRDVLETPAAKRDRKSGMRISIDTMDDETLRKRKGTVNTLIGILRVALRMAWENAKTDNDRAWRSLRRVPNVFRPRMLHLSREECRRLLRCTKPDAGRLILGALYTGCRATELLRMQARDVGRDGYGLYVTPVKRYRPRFVFLPDEGMTFFLGLAKGKGPSDFLFTRIDGRAWYGLYKKPFKDAVVAAGLPADFTFHGLRHTYASQLVQAGTPLPVVAEQLGHANATAVSTTYGHLSPQIRESEVRQRFSPLSPEYAKAAARQKKTLNKWRRSLHGTDWRSYAAINDLKSRAKTE